MNSSSISNRKHPVSPSKQKQHKGRGGAASSSSSSYVASQPQRQQQRLIEQEEEEIRRLEARLGIKRRSTKKGGNGEEDAATTKSSKDKDLHKLRKEYALEGYGNDFVDFLDSLDTLAEDVLRSDRKRGNRNDDNDDEENEDEEDAMDDGSSHSSSRESSAGMGRKVKPDRILQHVNPASDEENSEEESSRSSDDDDASSLHDLEEDDSVMSGNDDEGEEEEEDDDDDDEGEMPGKSPLEPDGNNSDREPSTDEEDDSANDDAMMSGDEPDGAVDDESGDDDGSTAAADDDDKEEEEKEKLGPDGTYRPSRGQDIYGKALPNAGPKAAPSAYVPPHLRNNSKSSHGKASIETATAKETKEQHHDDKVQQQQQDQQQLRQIQSELNRALNRLSEDTIVPTVASICRVYTSHPHSVVNAGLWDTVRRTCVASNTSMIMVKMVPLYAAALAGVHIRLGDSAQLGEHCMERIVLELCTCLEDSKTSANDINRSRDVADDDPSSGMDKTPANLLLLLGYLYNYGVVHCTLVYGIVRRLIDGFPAALEVELLLLVLGHCGRALRSDDPAALKEIVLAVQAKQREVQQQQQQQLPASSFNAANASSSSSSRVEYMIEAMMDLKNNKKRRQDAAHAERTAQIRKILGQVKRISESGGGALGGGSSNSSSLRITLDDILHAETRGRWWKVGASWAGNQVPYQSENGTAGDDAAAAGPRALASSNARSSGAAPTTRSSTDDEKLLALASKFRMNTDLRRAIFCVIMGSADCDDAFEKLVRGEMLKPRNEREAARVLMECCGGEKSFNKFYPHLAHRMCQFQPQCKFSFQLAYWDTFKRFDGMKVRKVANLAKLLFELVVVHRDLKLNVLKPIDMASPNDLAEPALIILTIFFSHVMDHFDDAAMVTELFASAIVTKKRRRSRGKVNESDHDSNNEGESEDDDDSSQEDRLDAMDEGDALRAGMLVFFVQVLKASPDYKDKKEGRYRCNVKAAIKACDVDAFF
jgi:nucleolar MIF4G domain-containing protein 1